MSDGVQSSRRHKPLNFIKMKEAVKAGIAQTAKSLIGKPYKYGAWPEEAPEFFDCSSFIQYVFRQVGIELPRSTILQANEGTAVTLEEIEPGDLLFFHGTQGFYNEKFPAGIGHVVLYTGDNKTIHAASHRIQENPEVIETGQVEEKSLEEVIEKLKPLMAVKRII